MAEEIQKKEFYLDEYKFLLKHLHDLNDKRNGINNFYLSLSSYILTATSLLNNSEFFKQPQHNFLNIILLIGGAISISWITSLLNINKIIDVYETALKKREEKVDIKIFTELIPNKTKMSPFIKIALYELVVPLCLLFGFIYFYFMK